MTSSDKREHFPGRPVILILFSGSCKYVEGEWHLVESKGGSINICERGQRVKITTDRWYVGVNKPDCEGHTELLWGQQVF